MITQNAKYTLPNPQISSMNASLPNENNNPQKEETEEEQLHTAIINAARMNQPNNNPSDKTTYNPTRCKACGKTQKECHQAMKTLHDPDDPTKCCFSQNLRTIRYTIFN